CRFNVSVTTVRGTPRRLAMLAWVSRRPAHTLAWRTCSALSAAGRPGRLAVSPAGPDLLYSDRNRDTCSGRSPDSRPTCLPESALTSVSETSTQLRTPISPYANSKITKGPWTTRVRPHVWMTRTSDGGMALPSEFSPVRGRNNVPAMARLMHHRVPRDPIAAN